MAKNQPSRDRSTSKGTRGGALLADVAAAAGVSIASASRALSGAAGVSDEQRARIAAIAEQLDYHQNPSGRSLRSGRTNLIGVWVESISNASSGRLVTALNDALHAHGYDILVTEYSDDPAEDASRIRALARRRPDFMVVLHPPRSAAFERLVRKGQKVVLIASGRPSSWSSALVAVDTSASRRELATHLVELGHRRLLVLQPARRIGRPGFNMLQRVAKRLKLPLELEVLPFAGSDGGPGLTSAEAVSRLQGTDGATFVQVNEALAPDLLGGIGAAGLRIPEDVSVMTTGAPPWAEIVRPPLSVTTVDYYEAGRQAAEAILELAGGGEPTRRVVRGKYIRRASVGPARGLGRPASDAASRPARAGRPRRPDAREHARR
ncbi:MAG: LacI family DNA-binding transcriptional regulator [Dehalococcoidia bacterium]